MKRLIPPKLVVLLVLLMIALSVVVPRPQPGPNWVRIVGVIPIVAGATLAAIGSRLFTRVGTNIYTFADPDRFVVEGPFTWTRNPMYLGMLVFLVGIATLANTVAAWVGPVLFFIAADRWYIPFEEARMSGTFGEPYQHYRSGVRRWIGRRQRQPS